MSEASQIHSARLADLDEVVALDSTSFARAWTAKQWRDVLNDSRAGLRIVRANDALGGRLLGLSSWVTVAGECELHRIAVRGSERGRGLGRDLLNDVLAQARAEAAWVVWLEVASRNSAARGLYAAAGFAQAGLRPGYYSDPADDAVILRRSPP